MTEHRYTLVARTLDRVEVLFLDQTVTPEHRGQTWLEIECGKCRQQFQITARTLDKIVRRYGYVYCANAECGVQLHALTQSEANDLMAARADN